MAKTYGPLGPSGENRDPAFLRSLALVALARRAGPGGIGRPRGEEDFIQNPLARDRYTRSMLDERLRGMIADREATQAGVGLARRGQDLQAELGRGQMSLGQGSLEEQIRSQMAGEGIQGRRLGMEEQFGADRRLGMEREYGLGMRGADLAERGAGLAERSLEEQIRANIAGEGLRGREVSVLESTGGNRDPEKRAQAEFAQMQMDQARYGTLSAWAWSPGPTRRIRELLGKKDVSGALNFIRENNPDATPQDISRVMNEIILELSQQGRLTPKDPWYAPPRWGIRNPENDAMEQQLMQLLGGAQKWGDMGKGFGG